MSFDTLCYKLITIKGNTATIDIGNMSLIKAFSITEPFAHSTHTLPTNVFTFTLEVYFENNRTLFDFNQN